MSVALYTTTVSVSRIPIEDESEEDPWEPSSPTPAATAAVIATGVRGDISPNMGKSGGPGDTQTMEFLLVCDPTDVTFRDRVTDERTGAVYQVDWSILLPGLPGFEHVQAGLRQVSGFGN